MQLQDVIDLSIREYLSSQYAHCSELLFRNVTGAWDSGFDKSLVRIATPFGGGLAGRQDVCGALVGGTMAIGYLFGRRSFQEDDKIAWRLAGEYYRCFKERFNSTTCRRIRGRIVDWNSHVKCSGTVETSISILWSILEKAADEGIIVRP